MTRATTSDELSVTNRTIARLRGDRTYQSAFICKRGHTERYTSTNQCKGCSDMHSYTKNHPHVRDEATIRRDLARQLQEIMERQAKRWTV